jgi:aspartyl-tRNA synthetase
LAIPDNASVYAISRNVKKGYLVEIRGAVRECPASVQREKENLRKIEIEIGNLAILSARNEKENLSRKFLARSKNLISKVKKKI